MARTARRLIIEGRVQRVGYRWWTVRQAMSLRLDGWVRNRRDGAVEALAIGDPAALDHLAEACVSGPAGAQVTGVTASPAEDDGSTGFVLREDV